MTDSPSLFIAGTDTGVGKSVVTAALVSLLRGRHLDVVPMKPIQTGCARASGELVAPDLQFCLQMTDLVVDSRSAGQMCPYRYEPACSPHLAAELCGDVIRIETIERAFCALQAAHAGVIVEGAGGVLVPINDQHTMLDVMVALGLPVLLVSRPTLGTLNHTLLSVREIRRAGLELAGVLFCETSPTTWGRLENDNWQTIKHRGEVSVWGKVPYMPGLAEGEVTPAEFHAKIATTIHLEGYDESISRLH
jgi:dethiobiotin synthetase